MNHLRLFPLLALLLGACGDPESEISLPPPPYALIEVVPSSVELVVGQSAQLRAIPHESVPANTRITWHSADTLAATVSGSGLVTGVKPGGAVLTAFARLPPDDRLVSATVGVTVRAAP
jgi:uncharacterized protein YjdB